MRTEEACEFDFRRKGPYWHLYTPGNLTEIIFTCKEEFLVGMNLVAVCLAIFPGLRIVTFTLMNNHFHFIIAGSREDVVEFFAMYRKRLKRYLAGLGRYPDLSGLVPDTFEIPDFKALRNEIVYVNRNGYVVQPEQRKLYHSRLSACRSNIRLTVASSLCPLTAALPKEKAHFGTPTSISSCSDVIRRLNAG